MIKSSELRIGNMIIRKSTGEVIRVEAIDIVGIAQENIDSMYTSLYAPIILTEDWINKFGLANGKEIFSGLTIYQNRMRDGSGRYDGYHFSTTRADVEYRFILGFSVKTVHHLQNLYYVLTGQELTIIE